MTNLNSNMAGADFSKRVLQYMQTNGVSEKDARAEISKEQNSQQNSSGQNSTCSNNDEGSWQVLDYNAVVNSYLVNNQAKQSSDGSTTYTFDKNNKSQYITVNGEKIKVSSGCTGKNNIKVVVDKDGKIDIYNDGGTSLNFSKATKDLNINLAESKNRINITAGKGNDTVTVQEGCIAGDINGNAGDDTIINDGNVTNLNGGAGNDLTMNSKNGKVCIGSINAGDGGDITVNLGEVSGGIYSGKGDDTIVNLGTAKDIANSSGTDVLIGNLGTSQRANSNLSKIYDKDGYDSDGYDQWGYNRDGYDKDGNYRYANTTDWDTMVQKYEENGGISPDTVKNNGETGFETLTSEAKEATQAYEVTQAAILSDYGNIDGTRNLSEELTNGIDGTDDTVGYKTTATTFINDNLAMVDKFLDEAVSAANITEAEIESHFGNDTEAYSKYLNKTGDSAVGDYSDGWRLSYGKNSDGVFEEYLYKELDDGTKIDITRQDGKITYVSYTNYEKEPNIRAVATYDTSGNLITTDYKKDADENGNDLHIVYNSADDYSLTTTDNGVVISAEKTIDRGYIRETYTETQIDENYYVLDKKGYMTYTAQDKTGEYTENSYFYNGKTKIHKEETKVGDTVEEGTITLSAFTAEREEITELKSVYKNNNGYITIDQIISEHAKDANGFCDKDTVLSSAEVYVTKGTNQETGITRDEYLKRVPVYDANGEPKKDSNDNVVKLSTGFLERTGSKLALTGCKLNDDDVKSCNSIKRVWFADNTDITEINAQAKDGTTINAVEEFDYKFNKYTKTYQKNTNSDGSIASYKYTEYEYYDDGYKQSEKTGTYDISKKQLEIVNASYFDKVNEKGNSFIENYEKTGIKELKGETTGGALYMDTVEYYNYKESNELYGDSSDTRMTQSSYSNIYAYNPDQTFTTEKSWEYADDNTKDYKTQKEVTSVNDTVLKTSVTNIEKTDDTTTTTTKLYKGEESDTPSSTTVIQDTTDKTYKKVTLADGTKIVHTLTNKNDGHTIDFLQDATTSFSKEVNDNGTITVTRTVMDNEGKIKNETKTVDIEFEKATEYDKNNYPISTAGLTDSEQIKKLNNLLSSMNPQFLWILADEADRFVVYKGKEDSGVTGYTDTQQIGNEKTIYINENFLNGDVSDIISTLQHETGHLSNNQSNSVDETSVRSSLYKDTSSASNSTNEYIWLGVNYDETTYIERQYSSGLYGLVNGGSQLQKVYTGLTIISSSKTDTTEAKLLDEIWEKFAIEQKEYYKPYDINNAITACQAKNNGLNSYSAIGAFETIAECWDLFSDGSNDSEATLLTYFPETVKAVRAFYDSYFKTQTE